MAIQLPTTTATIVVMETTTDAHGHTRTTDEIDGATGPFPANIQIASGTELGDGTNVEYTHVGYIDVAAWPIDEASRLLDADGVVYDVVYAARVFDPQPSSGADLDCVLVGLQRVKRERVR